MPGNTLLGAGVHWEEKTNRLVFSSNFDELTVMKDWNN